MKTFVTFLGRGRDSKTTGYREAMYEFPDGSKKTTAFFGLTLAEYIQPDRIVILGTRSSQWGVLVENLASAGEEEDARLELIDAETQGIVSQKHLDNVTRLMCEAVGCNVVPRLIPFGRDEIEQYNILDVVAESVPGGRLDFDLTHGFRHFGMIGFLSAFMLARVQELTVEHLWYGALEMTEDGVTPVLKLEGLDRVRQWLDALNRFDATGNYRVFGSLLMKDGVDPEKAKHLENAAFHERTLNLSAAAAEIRQFIPVLTGHLTGASGLFKQRLADHLKWADLDKLSTQQAKLARQSLDRRDYLRAAIFGWESVITVVCEKKGIDEARLADAAIRQEQHVQSEVQSWPLRDGRQPGDNREACENLNQIRNALAHSSEPTSTRVQEMLRDEQKLRDGLQDAFNCLLPNCR